MVKLDKYISYVDFLGETFGDNYEIVLHDLSNPEHSIVAIVHGELSGRHVGGPVTDLTLKILKRFKQERKTYFSNYHGKTMNGHVFLCSSYFIQDEAGAAVAVLCINHNVTPYMQVREFITNHIIKDSGGLKMPDFPSNHEAVVKQEVSPLVPKAVANVFENFQGTVNDVIDTMITHVLRNYNVPVARLSGKERKEIVHALNESGLFLLKGGIPALAARLNVSEPTIYRHLRREKIENS